MRQICEIHGITPAEPEPVGKNPASEVRTWHKMRQDPTGSREVKAERNTSW
jgi:hypothetical protein